MKKIVRWDWSGTKPGEKMGDGIFKTGVFKNMKGAEVKKVYCKDCKYHGWDNLDKCYDGIPEKFLGLKLRGWTNRHRDCKYYKRKWWKVWVR